MVALIHTKGQRSRVVNDPNLFRSKVFTLKFSNDTKILATGDQANNLTLFKIKNEVNLEQIFRIKHQKYVFTIDFSKDSSILAVGDWA